MRDILWPLWLALAILVSGCRQFPEPNGVDLIAEFPLARQSYIVSGQGPVGRPAFRAYLGSGLRPDLDGDWARAEIDDQVQAFGFFLYQARPVSVIVTGRSERAKTVAFSCQGKAVGQATVGPKLDGFRLSISQDSVIKGMNWIFVENAGDVAWRDFRMFPSDSGLSTKTGLPLEAGVKGGVLSVPFGQSLDYSLTSPEFSRLVFEVDGWVESGGPALDPSLLEVEVRLIGDGPETPNSWTVRGDGQHKVDLPDGLGEFGLQLSARLLSSGGPLPGQVGVEFRQLKLCRSHAQPSTLPSPPVLTEPTPSRPTNVVVYVVDTLRADKLAAYGYGQPSSPNFDGLAQDSVLFFKAVAESPWTKPSVATIISGLESDQHGVFDFNDVLDPHHTTLAEILKEAGYQTFGVVANPLVGARFGFDQGFDKYLALPVTKRAADVNREAFKLLREKDGERPFFLYLQPIDPHLPYDPPEPFRSRALSWHNIETTEGEKLLPSTDKPGFITMTHHLYRQAALGLPPEVPQSTRRLIEALYDGEVATADAGIGEVIAWLKAQGVYDDTLIVVTSDHGEELLDRDWLGHMHTFYEELVRVPLLIKFPRGRGKGERSEEVFNHRDLLPTIVKELGLSVPKLVQGKSFQARESAQGLSQMKAGADAVEAGQSYSEFLQRGTSLRVGDLKLIHHDSSVKATLLRGLFDLSRDPTEQDNLILKRPLTALRLEAELARQKRRYSGSSEASKGPADVTRSILESLQYVR